MSRPTRSQPGGDLLNDEDRIPEVVRDEACYPAPGETEYRLWLDDASVEALAKGIVPESVCQRCYGMLEWKRRIYRNQAREKIA